MVRVEAEKQAKEKAEQKAREKAERQARERAERMKGRLERIEKEEKEKAEREAKEKADRGVKKREEEEKKKVPTSKLPSAWGSNVGKNDRSRKTSGLSQKEQKNEWGSSWDLGSIEKKDEPSGPPPIITSSIPGSILGGAGNFDIFATEKKDSPGCAEEVELRTPLTKKGKKGIDSLSNLSKVATPTEAADLGKLDILEDPGLNNASARVSISLENERFLDAEQEPSPTKPTRLVLAPEVPPEALSSTASESLKASKDVKDDVPTTPKHWPAPPLTTTHQPQIPTPAPAPAKTEPEKPLSLWERKKLNAATPPAPASSLFGGGGTMNSLSVWGDVSGGGNAESIAMPTLVGDRQSIFTDTARDRKRENQRENVTGGFLGSNPARRRNDSAQSGMTAKPVPKPAPAPAPVQQKSSGWGSWGSSVLANIASATADPDRSPSPELPPVKPKIEDPPRRFTPSQPPKSQPAGFGPLSKPGWGTGGGTGDNNVWGAGKPGPAPITQKTSTGPSWGAKPTGSMFGSGVGKNLTVDTATKSLERGLSTTGPENTPESAVEVKHVLALGGFNTKVSSRVEEKAPKAQTEETGEPVRTEEVTTPAEEDEFDRANQGKKGHVTSVA
ncbi:hypothetical protein BDM02DRAFT_2470886 [Thelephora ganbajun]|uniref:Uncharacterized protein n=1 Tax=Thelephora ganbajun TaxID=370292 RepID=A0ACB6YYB3_THEGA|nr:hypothetical protein BDM02DRAFT_2470886 [Thelephora ganbajun]